MAFGKIKAQGLKPGKTVPLVLNQLEGRPIVHVEHLGETNATWWNESVARAEAKAVPEKAGKVTTKSLAVARAKNRETVIKHAVRHLENVFHDDGRAATDADIQEFIEELPDDVFDTIKDFVVNPENFRDQTISGDPDKLAGK